MPLSPMATTREAATRQRLIAAHVDGRSEGDAYDEEAGALTFQVISWHAVDEEEEDSGEDEAPAREGSSTKYVLRAFGVTAGGRSVCLRIEGFTPFLYVKLPVPLCRGPRRSAAIGALLQHLGGFGRATHLRKKDFWGFTNGELFDFVRITFPSRAAMRRAASRLVRPQKVGGALGGAMVPMQLYEANMDPMLRFLHVRGLRPVGWVKATGVRLEASASSCQLSAACPWQAVSPLSPEEQDRRGQAPLLVAGFDIECNSAHGDFPVARKDYRRLAIDVEGAWSRPCTGAVGAVGSLRGMGDYDAKERLVAIALAALGLADESEHKEVARLELKRRPARGTAEAAALERTVKRVMDDVHALLRDDDKAAADARRTAGRAKAKPTIHPEDEQQEEQQDNSTIGRLTAVLNGAFADRWPLHGDAVIQIGLTVGLYGAAGCCSKHILTLGSCEPIAGSDVCVFEKEEDMLEAFVELVRAIDPDVLLGYNIFGFDLSYLHERAGELMGEARRTARFHRFGRVSGLPSAYVEQKLSSSALGDNVLKYLDMHGRVVVDLMKASWGPGERRGARSSPLCPRATHTLRGGVQSLAGGISR